MSAQAEVIAPGAAPIAPLRVGDAELAQGHIAGSAALPFAEPFQFSCPAWLTLAEIVEGLFAAGLIERAWEPRLAVFIGDVRFPRESWARVKPRPGRLVAVRAEPGLEAAAAIGSAIISTIFSWNFVAAIAIQVGLSAFVGAEGPAAQSFEQLKDIDASRNEFAPFRKVPVVLGRFRTFPPHGAKGYTIGEGERVILRMLLCWGVGPLAIDDALLKIGDTPIGDFAGVTVQHRLKPGDAWPTIFPSSVDEDAGPGLVAFGDGWVARTTTSDECEQLQVEIAFPEGLIFYSSDGDQKSFSVELRIRYREVGATDWLSFSTGAVATEGHLYTESGRYAKPFRKTYKRTVAAGKYEVAVKRNIADDPGPKGKNAFHWTKLRSFTFEQPVLDDNLAVTAIEIEAGDQLSGVVDLINGVVTRIAPLWDSGAEAFGAAGETRNPAELFRWVAMGPGAPKPRTAEEVDDATLGAWAELCTARGWKCDLEIRAGMGMDEVLDTIARCGRATRIEKNGKLSVVIDDVQPAPAQHFTPRNCWGFRSQRRYAAETHALRAQFNNEDKAHQRDEMMVYYPGFDAESAEIVRTVPMIGKTDPDEVYASAKRIIAEELLRPEDYAFRCDVEHLALKLGQRITVAHPVIAVGRQSARVKAVTLNEAETHVVALTLDEDVTQTPGDTYGLIWRSMSGEGEEEAVIAVSEIALENMGNGKGRVVTLAAETPIASAPKAGDLVTFGDANIVVIDAVVLNVTPSSDLEAEVLAQPYSPDLFSGDDEEVPAWSSNVSASAFPAPPAPEIKGVAATPTGMFVDFDYAPAIAHRVRATELYWKSDADDGERLEPAGVLPAESRVAAFPAGVRGANYVLKLISVGERGQRTAATVEVVSTGFTGPLTGHLSRPAAVVATAPDGSGGDYSDAGGTFQVFVGGVDVTGETDVVVYSVEDASAGLSIAIDEETGVYTITGLSADAGQARLRAHIISRNENVELFYAIAKALGGAPGADGAAGLNVARVRIYQRAASTPSLPSATTTFTFATGGLTGLNNGWTTTIPAADGNPLYVSEATASGTGATDTIASGEWASAVIMAQDGQDGADGTNGSNGANGLNSATVWLFQRAASAPSVPGSTTTYTFATGVLSGTLGSWSQTIPAHNGNPLYVTTATALSAAATDTIASGEWATPRVHAQDGADGANGAAGADGLSVVELVIFRRASSAPSTPTGGSYNFGTLALTAPTDWSSAIPAGNDPVYASRGVAAVQGVSGVDSSITWSAPVLLTQEGSAVDIIFQRSASAPSTPSPSSGVPSGWSSTVSGAPGTGPLWSSIGTRANAGQNWTWEAPVKVEGEDGANGSNGSNGADAASYWLTVSAAALKKNSAGAYTPSTITAAAKTQTGAGAPGNYSGRFIIAEDTGSGFSDVYTSASNESSKTHTPGANIVALRVRLYQAGGTSNLLFEQIVPVVTEPTAPFKVTVSPVQHSKTRLGAGTTISNTISATPANGSGSYSYSWAIAGSTGGSAAMSGATNTANAAISLKVGAGESHTATARVTVTDNGTGEQVTAQASYTLTELS